MRGLSVAQERRLGEIKALLATYSLRRDSVSDAVDAARELLDTDHVLLYSLCQREGGSDLRVRRRWGTDRRLARTYELFDRWLEGKGVSFSAYNPLRPEPLQRDRVLWGRSMAKLGVTRTQTELYPLVGATGYDTVRALVCDRASLLAYFGAIQPHRATATQAAITRALVRPLRQRLLFERSIGQDEPTAAALTAALERVAGAAYVLDAGARVVHANAAGRSAIDRGATVDRAEILASAAAGATVRSGDTLVPLGERDRTIGFVLVRPPLDRHRARDPLARLGLTPAQTRVAGLVVQGWSNATIAAELAVAERTVEAHVTAILEKAQVGSRAALIARLLGGGHG